MNKAMLLIPVALLSVGLSACGNQKAHPAPRISTAAPYQVKMLPLGYFPVIHANGKTVKVNGHVVTGDQKTKALQYRLNYQQQMTQFQETSSQSVPSDQASNVKLAQVDLDNLLHPRPMAQSDAVKLLVKLGYTNQTAQTAVNNHGPNFNKMALAYGMLDYYQNDNQMIADQLRFDLGQARFTNTQVEYVMSNWPNLKFVDPTSDKGKVLTKQLQLAQQKIIDAKEAKLKAQQAAKKAAEKATKAANAAAKKTAQAAAKKAAQAAADSSSSDSSNHQVNDKSNTKKQVAKTPATDAERKLLTKKYQTLTQSLAVAMRTSKTATKVNPSSDKSDAQTMATMLYIELYQNDKNHKANLPQAEFSIAQQLINGAAGYFTKDAAISGASNIDPAVLHAFPVQKMNVKFKLSNYSSKLASQS